MRLRNPNTGTVVTPGESLEKLYLAQGWVDADAKPVPETEPPEPKRRGRPPKNS